MYYVIAEMCIIQVASHCSVPAIFRISVCSALPGPGPAGLASSACSEIKHTCSLSPRQHSVVENKLLSSILSKSLFAAKLFIPLN